MNFIVLNGKSKIHLNFSINHPISEIGSLKIILLLLADTDDIHVDTDISLIRQCWSNQCIFWLYCSCRYEKVSDNLLSNEEIFDFN